MSRPILAQDNTRGTFRICECGHAMGEHSTEPMSYTEVESVSTYCGHKRSVENGIVVCTCSGFRQRADLEREAYDRAMRGE